MGFGPGIARHGRPIQYAHVAAPLALWDVWTPIAGPPFAFEPPSAGFAIDWRMLAAMADRGAEFATITHAAGISIFSLKDEPGGGSIATRRRVSFLARFSVRPGPTNGRP